MNGTRRQRALVVLAVAGASLLVLGAVASTVSYAVESNTGLVGGWAGELATLSCPANASVEGLSVSFRNGRIGSAAPLCGAQRQSASTELSCHAGDELVGLYGAARKSVDRLGIICRSARGNIYWGALIGGYRGEDFELLCPAETRVSSLRVRKDRWLSAVGITCTPSPAPAE